MTVSVEPAAIRAWAEGRMIFVELTDGRIIGFPADRFKILKNATDEQLKEVKIRLNGYALTQLPHLFYKNCKNYHVFFKK
jgi:hypothetical protein